jgi:hypothetical protein
MNGMEYYEVRKWLELVDALRLEDETERAIEAARPKSQSELAATSRRSKYKDEIRRGIKRTSTKQPIVTISTESILSQMKHKPNWDKWPSGKKKHVRENEKSGRSKWICPMDELDDGYEYYDAHYRANHAGPWDECPQEIDYDCDDLSNALEVEEADAANDYYMRYSRINRYKKQKTLSSQKWIGKKKDVWINVKASKKRRR